MEKKNGIDKKDIIALYILYFVLLVASREFGELAS